VADFLGPGTVTVFIMRDEDPQPVPNDEQLAEVQDYMEPLRPVTAELHVLAPDAGARSFINCA
jgi:uncharacterized phage protein gp47/JayE